MTDAISSNFDVATMTVRQVMGQGKSARAKLEETAKDFESVFMAQMLKPMWEGVETNALFGGGAGEDVMRDMLVQEYGKSMAKADGYSLSGAVLDAMLRMQSGSDAAKGAGA